MAKYLDESGLSHFWGKIKSWIRGYVTVSVDGSGDKTITYKYDPSSSSSSEVVIQPITTAERTKLGGIATGAEVNQNAFSNIRVGSTTVAADSKTDTLELVAGTNISLSPDATNDKVTINVTGIADGAEVNLNAFSNVKVGSTTIAADSKTDTLEVTAGSNITLTPDATNDKVTVALSESPALTGTPTAPTAAAGTNTTLIATTAFVKNAVDSKHVMFDLGYLYDTTTWRHDIDDSFPGFPPIDEYVYLDPNSENTAHELLTAVIDNAHVSIKISTNNYNENFFHLERVLISGTSEDPYYSYGFVTDGLGVSSYLLLKLSGSVDGNASISITIDSTHDDTKADKVSGATANNLAALDANGNLIDSGVNATSAGTDTKNTAGSTDSSSKLFIIGATSLAANPQTYSQDTAYVGTDGHLYSDSKLVVNLSGSLALTNKTYNGYTLSTACAKGVDTSIGSSSSSNLPTTDAVKTYVTSLMSSVTGALVYKGTVSTESSLLNIALSKGWYYIVIMPDANTTSVTIGGFECEAGDMIIVKTAGTYTTTANLGNAIDVIQSNIARITNTDIDGLPEMISGNS